MSQNITTLPPRASRADPAGRNLILEAHAAEQRQTRLAISRERFMPYADKVFRNGGQDAAVEVSAKFLWDLFAPPRSASGLDRTTQRAEELKKRLVAAIDELATASLS